MMLERVDLFSMFILGLSGTGHCIGMCGPLVFSLPGRTGRFTSHLVYHAGRLLTYAFMGGLMGGLSSGFTDLIGTGGPSPLSSIRMAQVILSVFAGVFMAVFGLSRLGIISEPGWMSTASPDRLPGWKAVFRSAATDGGFGAMFMVGLFLGLLPCGLSYAAFAMALTSKSVMAGALMLLGFGLGTVPGLILIGTGASSLFRRYRRISDLLSGIIMIAMAVMLIVKAVLSFLTIHP